MKVQDLSNPPARLTREQLLRQLVVLGALLGALLAAAHIGAAKSERAHRALDAQYRQCIDRYGYGGEHFPECLRGGR